MRLSGAGATKRAWQQPELASTPGNARAVVKLKCYTNDRGEPVAVMQAAEVVSAHKDETSALGAATFATHVLPALCGAMNRSRFKPQSDEP